MQVEERTKKKKGTSRDHKEGKTEQHNKHRSTKATVTTQAQSRNHERNVLTTNQLKQPSTINGLLAASTLTSLPSPSSVPSSSSSRVAPLPYQPNKRPRPSWSQFSSATSPLPPPPLPADEPFAKRSHLQPEMSKEKNELAVVQGRMPSSLIQQQSRETSRTSTAAEHSTSAASPAVGIAPSLSFVSPSSVLFPSPSLFSSAPAALLPPQGAQQLNPTQQEMNRQPTSTSNNRSNNEHNNKNIHLCSQTVGQQ